MLVTSIKESDVKSSKVSRENRTKETITVFMSPNWCKSAF